MADVLASNLMVKLYADISEYERNLIRAKRLMEDFSESFKDQAAVLKTAGLAIAGFGASITAALGLAVNAAQQEERSINTLKISLEQHGISWDKSRKKIDDFTESTIKMTRFSDTHVRGALTRMLIYTNNLDNAFAGVKLAMDMSTTGLYSFETASHMVDMAMAGNLQTLGRWIPELRASDNALISNMNSSERAAYAIDILRKKFGGFSDRELNTFSVAISQLKNRFGDLTETIGTTLLPTLTSVVQKMTEVTKSMNSFSDTHKDYVESFTKIAASIGLIASGVGAILLAAGGVAAFKGILLAITAAFGAWAAPLLIIASAVSIIVGNWKDLNIILDWSIEKVKDFQKLIGDPRVKELPWALGLMSPIGSGPTLPGGGVGSGGIREYAPGEETFNLRPSFRPGYNPLIPYKKPPRDLGVYSIGRMLPPSTAMPLPKRKVPYLDTQEGISEFYNNSLYQSSATIDLANRSVDGLTKKTPPGPLERLAMKFDKTYGDIKDRASQNLEDVSYNFYKDVWTGGWKNGLDSLRRNFSEAGRDIGANLLTRISKSIADVAYDVVVEKGIGALVDTIIKYFKGEKGESFKDKIQRVFVDAWDITAGSLVAIAGFISKFIGWLGDKLFGGKEIQTKMGQALEVGFYALETNGVFTWLYGNLSRSQNYMWNSLSTPFYDLWDRGVFTWFNTKFMNIEGILGQSMSNSFTALDRTNIFPWLYSKFESVENILHMGMEKAIWSLDTSGVFTWFNSKFTGAASLLGSGIQSSFYGLDTSGVFTWFNSKFSSVQGVLSSALAAGMTFSSTSLSNFYSVFQSAGQQIAVGFNSGFSGINFSNYGNQIAVGFNAGVKPVVTFPSGNTLGGAGTGSGGMNNNNNRGETTTPAGTTYTEGSNPAEWALSFLTQTYQNKTRKSIDNAWKYLKEKITTGTITADFFARNEDYVGPASQFDFKRYMQEKFPTDMTNMSGDKINQLWAYWLGMPQMPANEVYREWAMTYMLGDPSFFDMAMNYNRSIPTTETEETWGKKPWWKKILTSVGIPGFASGGIIPGIFGQSRLIKAHVGEGVLNSRAMSNIGEKGLNAINAGNTSLSPIIVNVTGNTILNDRDASDLADRILSAITLKMSPMQRYSTV